MKSVQCRMARAALMWNTLTLAKQANVGVNTVNRFEAGEGVWISSVEKIQAALQKAGVVFIEDDGEGLGVRLKRRSNQRHQDGPSPAERGG